MKKIIFNKYPPQLVEIHYNDEIHMVNGDELLDIQNQIVQNQIEGVYIMHKGEKITINLNGELSKWPTGMLDQSQKLFACLYNSRFKK